jgi:predicted lipid-binding transport protein (Tim44 family)
MNELQLAYSQQDLGELRNLRTQDAFDSLST